VTARPLSSTIHPELENFCTAVLMKPFFCVHKLKKQIPWVDNSQADAHVVSFAVKLF
jgi:hypothetical protein